MARLIKGNRIQSQPRGLISRRGYSTQIQVSAPIEAEQDIAPVEEITSPAFSPETVRLNTGEYVLKTEFTKLTPAQQSQLMTQGIALFNSSQDRALAATVVQLNTGDFLAKDTYDTLSPEDKSLIMAVGVSQYNAIKGSQAGAAYEAEMAKYVQLQTGEYFPRASQQPTDTEPGYVGFDDMTPYDQSLLKSVGVTQFNAIKQQEYAKDNIEVRPGEFINRGFYENLPPNEQGFIKTQGVAAYNAGKQAEVAEKQALFNRAIQWMRVDDDGNRIINIVDAIGKGGFTTAELNKLQITDEQIRAAYNAEPGFNTIAIPPEQQFAQLQEQGLIPKEAVLSKIENGQVFYSIPESTSITGRQGGFLITPEMEELEPYVTDRGAGGQAQYNIQAYIADKGVSAETIGVLQSVGYSAPVINAIVSLAPYGGNLPQFVRDNPQAESIMAVAGYKPEDIAKIAETARLSPSFDTFMNTYNAANGVTQADIDASNKYLEYYQMPQDMRYFYAKRDGVNLTELKASADKVASIVKAGAKEYQERYGTGAVVSSAAGMITPSLLAAGRALRPDVELKDITTAEWITTAAQIAALSAGVVGGAGKVGAGLAKVLSGASVVGFPVATAIEWKTMTPTQRIISASVDTVFALLMVGVPVGKFIRTQFNWMAVDSRYVVAAQYEKLAQAVMKGNGRAIKEIADNLIAYGKISKVRGIAGADDIIRQASYFSKNAKEIAKNASRIQATEAYGANGKLMGELYDELSNLTRAQGQSELILNAKKVEQLTSREISIGAKPASVEQTLKKIKATLVKQKPLLRKPGAAASVIVFANEPPVKMTLDELAQFYMDGIGLSVKTSGYVNAVEKYGKTLAKAYDIKALEHAAAERMFAQKTLAERLASRGKGAVTRAESIEKVVKEGGFMEYTPDSYVIKGVGVANYTKGQMLDDIARLGNPKVRVMDGGFIEVSLNPGDIAKLKLKYGFNPLGERIYLSPNTMSRVAEIQKGTIKGFSEFGTGERFKAELKRGADWAVEAKDPLRNTNKILNDRIFKIEETGNKLTLSPDEVARYTYDDLFIEIPTSRLNPNKSLVPLTGNSTDEIAQNLINSIRQRVENYGFTAAIMMYGEDLVKAVYPQALEAALREEEEGNMPNSAFYGTVTPKTPIDPGGGVSVATLRAVESAIAKAQPIWQAQLALPTMSIQGATIPTDTAIVTGNAIASIATAESQQTAIEPEIASVSGVITDTEIGVRQPEPTTISTPATTQITTPVSTFASGTDIEPTLTPSLVTSMVTQPVVAPAPLPSTKNKPQPVPLKQEIPIPVPIPVPIPIPNPLPTTITDVSIHGGRMLPPKSKKRSEKEEEERAKFNGAFAFKHGFGWVALKKPYYRKEDIKFFRIPPPGIIDVTGGKGAAYRSIQQYLEDNDLPDISIKRGIMKITITKERTKEPGAVGAIKFETTQRGRVKQDELDLDEWLEKSETVTPPDVSAPYQQERKSDNTAPGFRVKIDDKMAW